MDNYEFKVSLDYLVDTVFKKNGVRGTAHLLPLSSGQSGMWACTGFVRKTVVPMAEEICQE